MFCDFIFCDALQKVLPNAEPEGMKKAEAEGFGGETLFFQLAYRRHYCPEKEGPVLLPHTAKLSMEGDKRLTEHTEVFRAELVPVTLPLYPDRSDEDYLFREAQLAPDLLQPLEGERIRMVPEQWRSLWFEVSMPEDLPAGDYPLTIRVEDDDVIDWTGEIVLRKLPGVLPEQTLIRTEWFHADCLADYYACEVFSEKHWTILENFMQAAVRNGVNMLYCPIFTPPLDTAEGGERTTVQLLRIAADEGRYRFDFTLLDRWLDAAERAGIEYFEMAHLFTQWGARHAPKIMAEVNGELKQIFGWETDALSSAYKDFLYALIPALKGHLQKRNCLEKTYFHISDEPTEADLHSYRKAKELVEPLLRDCRVIDALSDFAFYEKGLVEKPIPSSDHIEPFLQAGIPGLWTYYCCSQGVKVSNRFMAMPSRRNRMIGVQLYKYDIEGFLHWGFNFYNTQYSIRPVNDGCGRGFSFGGPLPGLSRRGRDGP